MAPQVLAEKRHAAPGRAGAQAHRYKNFINGQWVDSSSGKTVPNINPANTEDVIGHAPQSTRDEARAAIEAARAAFPAWRNTPAQQRGRIVAKAVQLCYERREEIARIMTREEGKTLTESSGEVQ
jgi:aldehyde dehydrogenase (NAD+)